MPTVFFVGGQVSNMTTVSGTIQDALRHPMRDHRICHKPSNECLCAHDPRADPIANQSLQARQVCFDEDSVDEYDKIKLD